MSSETNSEIRVVCEKCDKYMDLFQSLHSTYYRCRRFPLCDLTANPQKVSEAIEKKKKTSYRIIVFRRN